MNRRFIGVAVTLLALIAIIASVYLPRLLRLRHIDATYAGTFLPPSSLAPDLGGKRVLFHLKTRLKQDDSQICAAFNVILAALAGRARVTLVFDSGAVLDLDGDKLAHTRVPLRLQKMIVAQTHIDGSRVPHGYAEYLRLIHELGAEIYADTDMNVVTGVSERISDRVPGFPFVQPISWVQVTHKIAGSEVVVVY